VENPTYYQLGDHTETLQVDYDPTQISYKEILDLFWDGHNPTGPQYTRQYISIIFYHDEDQEKVGLESKEAREKVLGAEINTLIIPYTHFYLAEDYHQKYFLQGDSSLSSEVKGYFEEFQEFVNSTAAARLNGIVGGYANPELLESELSEYGLSDSGMNNLQRYIK